MSAFGATPGPTFQSLSGIVSVLYAPSYVDPSLRTPKPAAVPAVCVPWLLQSSGLGSGCGTESGLSALYALPTKSQPPFTFGERGPNSVLSCKSVEGSTVL